MGYTYKNFEIVNDGEVPGISIFIYFTYKLLFFFCIKIIIFTDMSTLFMSL